MVKLFSVDHSDQKGSRVLWWWWWIVFVVWLTDKRRLALFPAGTLQPESQRLSPSRIPATRRDQDLNLRRNLYLQSLFLQYANDNFLRNTFRSRLLIPSVFLCVSIILFIFWLMTLSQLLYFFLRFTIDFICLCHQLLKNADLVNICCKSF